MAVTNTSGFEFFFQIQDPNTKTYRYELEVPPFLDSNILVFQDGTAIDENDYTLNEDTRTITFGAAVTLVANNVIKIERQTPITQLEQFADAGYVHESEIENAVDKLTYIAQEIRGKLGN